MKKFQIISDTTDYADWFEDKNGTKYNIKRYYTNRIDLENQIEYDFEETSDYPTLEELTNNGTLTYKTAYNEAEVYYKCSPYRISVKEVIKKFKKQGYNVTREAIEHNFNAYLMDMKSGYRDEENGYHLFTPCRHNNLSFRLSTLNKNCDWQTTYTC